MDVKLRAKIIWYGWSTDSYPCDDFFIYLLRYKKKILSPSELYRSELQRSLLAEKKSFWDKDDNNCKVLPTCPQALTELGENGHGSGGVWFKSVSVKKKKTTTITTTTKTHKVIITTNKYILTIKIGELK